jgi:putative two-component system response regulator
MSDPAFARVAARPKILIIDDQTVNLRVVEAMLTPMGYECATASDGGTGIAKAQEWNPDCILLDVMMPDMDGFETARRLRQDDVTRHTPIVMVTALQEIEARVKALEAGADDFLAKPVDKTELRARVQSLVKIKSYQDRLENQQRNLEEAVAQQTEQLRRALKNLQQASLDTIIRLARASEYKDEDTGMHIQRMSHYAAAIARKIGLPDEEADNILYAAPMHDIGKIGIPDSILLKPDRLTEAEWDVMKQHTVIGACILEGSGSPLVELGRVIALTHHEKWDGSGYPQGLIGEEIPLMGRIASLSDVFDALVSRRPYKDPISVDETCDMMKAGRGKHFDPAVLDAFLAIVDEVATIRKRYRDFN